jgi:hypothetical protein
MDEWMDGYMGFPEPFIHPQTLGDTVTVTPSSQDGLQNKLDPQS